MNYVIKATEKEKDFDAIIRGEEKFKTLIEANNNLRLHATEAADILSNIVKINDKYSEIDFEIILEILNDVSFASMVLENNLYEKIITLKKESDESIKKRIISAIENYIAFWLEQM